MTVKYSKDTDAEETQMQTLQQEEDSEVVLQISLREWQDWVYGKMQELS